MSPALISLVKVIGIKNEAIKINLITMNLLDRELAFRLSVNNAEQGKERKRRIKFILRQRTIVNSNLEMLGCSQSQRRCQNSLAYWLMYQNRLTDMEDWITGALFLATGRVSAARVWAGLRKTTMFFAKRQSQKHFDQILTSTATSSSTRPAESALQQNPPCAHELG